MILTVAMTVSKKPAPNFMLARGLHHVRQRDNIRKKLAIGPLRTCIASPSPPARQRILNCLIHPRCTFTAPLARFSLVG